MNAETPGDSAIGSLVASRIPDREGESTGVHRSYRVQPGPPTGRSYAREIAAQYGISYDQLVEQMKQRGVVE